MNTILHKANTRGHANHGWLEAHHTFSFANYYDPHRIRFGVLRVLNDDIIAGGKGFGMHPHDNMEIITIPLEGELKHKDNMGNSAVIKKGDVQVMSAGTGLFHSEYNNSPDQPVKLLQIWIFPNKKNVEPRYGQLSLSNIEKQNELYQILSPNKNDQGLWIHQDAWFHLGHFESGKTSSYQLKRKGNGVYVFILDGEVSIEEQKLEKRDGFGLWNIGQINIKSDTDSRMLLMEVPV